MNMSTLTDEELLSLFKQHGTHNFFSELVDRHEQRIIKKCYQHLRNKDDAQDVSQEVLILLLTKSHTYQSHLSFIPWLNAIIWHRCIAHLNQNKKELHLEISKKIANAIEEEIDTEAVSLPTVEILQKLLALEEVTGEDQTILFLKYGEGWSIKAIAESLNLNENTVKSRLKRTRERLQKLFIRYSDVSST